MRNHLLASSVLVLALVASACSDAEPAASAAATATEHRVDVAAMKVAVADLESTLQISGNLVPQTRVAVTAKLPGTLSSVRVDIGDRVRVGQVVAAIDRREIDAQVDAADAAVNVAHAGVEAADAALANAVLERDRAQNLFDRGALPKQRLDAAETARRSTAAQLDLAKGEPGTGRRRAPPARGGAARRDTRPRRSTAWSWNATTTREASSGPGDDPVVVVADLRVMKLEAGVSELEAGRLRVGMPARVEAQARPGDVFEGRVAAIAPEVDARNRHFRIEVRIANPGAALLSGMYGSATIPLERAAQVVAVPRDAVITRDGKRVVVRIEGDMLRDVPVTEGMSDGRLVQIGSGLQAGDTILSDARQDIAAGSKVNPVLTR